MSSSIIPTELKAKIDKSKWGLPLITGVKALSRNEIKKDLTEIEYCDKSDSESVSSADSGDVISSSYPVKPRKHARIQRDSRPSRPSKDTESSQSKEDAREYNAVEFLRVVESARPEIFEAEREREDLEIRFQALKEMCVSAEESFKKRKKEHENYIGAIQSTVRRSACEFQLRSRYNIMLNDLIQVAKANQKIQAEYSSGVDSKRDSSANGPSNDEQQAGIIFYQSQVLNTPMGPGSVSLINTDTSTLTIKLPFGVMYTAFSVAASWFMPSSPPTVTSGHGEYYHPANLPGRWTDPHQSTVGIDIRRTTEIRNIFTPPPPSPVAPAIHTKPEVSEVGATTPSKATSGGGKKKPKGKKGKKAVSPEKPELKSVEVAPVVEPVVAPLAAPRDDSDMSLDSYEFFDPVSRLSGLFIDPGTLPYLADQQFYRPSTTSGAASLPVPKFNAKGTIQLSAQALSTAYRHHRTDLDDKILFYPEKKDGEEEEASSESSEVMKQAVTAEDTNGQSVEGAPVGGNAASGEKTEIEFLLSELKPLLERMRECSRDKNRACHEVERLKLKTNEIYQKISCARLSSYTYRLLTGKYVPVAPTPPIKPAKVEKRKDRAVTRTVAEVAAVESNGHSASSSQDSHGVSPEPIVQYTYDSIGRRRPIKPPSNSAKNNKRRKSTPDENVHVVVVKEVSSDSDVRRPKRPRR